MISLSTAGELLLIRETFQKANVWPATAYLALFTVIPGKDSGGTECVGTGYARIAINFDSTTWTSPGASMLSNAADINFGTPTVADWGTLTGFAFMMGLTGTSQLSAGLPFATAKTPVVGTPVTFAAGTLVISALES